MKKVVSFVCLFLAFIFFATGISYAKGKAKHVPFYDGPIERIDYADFHNWLSAPEQATKDVDVFFVYPTSWRAQKGEFPLSDINNAEMRKYAMYYLKSRASAFEMAGNIYAPFYRQYDASFVLEALSSTETFATAWKYAESIPPLLDIVDSFEYYLKHFNKGKPFILVGHSQGSAALMELLTIYMKKHPKVYKKMVAAYLIGIPMPKEIYELAPHLKPAQKADDVGVIISYNTQSPKVGGVNPFSYSGNVLINPISWTTDEKLAPKSESLGSVVVKDDGSFTKVQHLADAQIDHKLGTIICYSVDPEKFSSEKASRAYFPLGVLHENDIPLYYYDLQKNAVDRVNAYFKIYKK
ncbi:MAG: DUF3089 domain-containing protein [Elusimicrobiota bacterium]|jgi:pimeloyl-ACP methyl ester carboxylesterase|nr:DUF3089 domain-containing protein [Elusimicrobiota bacterium]